jgi:hypothetical protein
MSTSTATSPAEPARQYCTHCGRTNHKIDDCYHLAKPKCSSCNKLGHKVDDCRFKKKNYRRQQKHDLVTDATKKEANIAEHKSDDEETLAAVETTSVVDAPSYNNEYENDVYLASTVNENSRMYDWLADTGSTNHISNQREIFSSYEPTPDVTVHGVGGKTVQVQGRGTIILKARYGTRERTIRLERVNYIPSNKYNILALGRWDSQGRRYEASGGQLTLYNCQNIPILNGPKIASNIYKFSLRPIYASTPMDNKIYSFSTKETSQTWETWHRRFGHISYKGLRKIYHEKLVDGFTVDQRSPQPDCTSCTEGKQSVKPFDKKNESTR